MGQPHCITLSKFPLQQAQSFRRMSNQQVQPRVLAKLVLCGVRGTIEIPLLDLVYLVNILVLTACRTDRERSSSRRGESSLMMVGRQETGQM